MSDVQLLDRHGKPIRTRALQKERYTQERYSLSRVIGQLPDPDAIWKKAGLDYWALRALTMDGHLFAAMESRAAGLAGLELRISDPEKADVKSRKATAMFQEVMANMCGVEDEDQDGGSLTALLQEAVYYGFQAAELMWEKSSSEWRPVKYRDVPHEWLGWDGETGDLRFYPEGDVKGEPVKPGKILMTRFKPKRLLPMGEKGLTRCFWPVTFKKGGWRFWANMLEHYGQPWLVAKSNMTDVDDLLIKLQKMVQNAIAILPTDTELEFPEPGRGRGKDFELFKNGCDSEMSKVILGSTLTMEVQDKGSYAASETHQEIRSEVVYSDAKIVASTLSRLARLVTDFNFGPETAAPVVEFWEEEDPQTEKLERDKGFAALGFRPTQEYLEETYGVELELFTQAGATMLPKAPQERRKKLANIDSLFAALLNARDAEDGFIESTVTDVAEAAGPEVDALIERTVSSLEPADSYADIDRTALEWAGYESLNVGIEKFAAILRDAFILARGVGQAAGGSDTQTANSILLNSPDYKVEFGALKPEEAIKYLEGKGYRISWNWWEVWQEEHASAFTVAKAMKLDILKDIRGAVQDALRDGTTLEQFKKELAPKLKQKGWWGKKEMRSPAGEKETVQLGSSFRLETIYHVNLQSAYQVGKWRGFRQNKEARPYLIYSAIMDRRTRPAHQDLHGAVYPIDDPFWLENYPPSDWRCRCTARSLSVDEFDLLEREPGLRSGVTMPSADEIGPPEWRYNVGIADARENGLDAMLNKKQDQLFEMAKWR